MVKDRTKERSLTKIDYSKYDFRYDTKNYEIVLEKGLNENVVKQISKIKNEPSWMTEFRLKALDIFFKKPMPTWGADLSDINFDEIIYYMKPSKENKNSWDDVPEDIKKTFDRLGIPEAERKFLGGVEAQFECLTADTKVFTNPHGQIEIKNLNEGDYVFSLDEQTNEIKKAKILKIWTSGKKKIFELNIANKKIKASSNHPFLRLTHNKKEGRRRGRYYREWIPLKDLKKGDLIAIAKKFPDFGKSYELKKPNISTNAIGRNQFEKTYTLDISHLYKKIALPDKTNEDLMWLFGFFLGDGYVSNGKKKQPARLNFAIPDTQQELRISLNKILKENFGYDAITHYKYYVSVSSKTITNFFETNGFSGKAKTKKVPNWVYSLPVKEILSFLAGFIDADGNVRDNKKNHDVVLTSANEELLNSMKKLAIYCGIQSSFKNTIFYSEISGKKYKAFRCSLSGNIQQLHCKHPVKSARLLKKKYMHTYLSAKNTDFSKHGNEFVGYAKIKDIKELDEELTYDIQVEGFHNFVAEEIIVHNSEVVYHSIREDLQKQGVVFLSMDQGLKEYPELVKEHFGKIVPFSDNKFAALNSAVWSGGSFLYIPKNTQVDIPLQAYFRINAQNMGQFERTLIIADEGSRGHYIEGCFSAGTEIRTDKGTVLIEEIQKNDKVLTHNGDFKEVYFTQIRPYTGELYKINIWGDTSTITETTEEHPLYIVRREKPNERNKNWKAGWAPAKDLKKGDYLAFPLNKKIVSNKFYEFEILKRCSGRYVEKMKTKIRAGKNFFKLAGYFLAEGSTNRGFYTSVSFGAHEKEYISETKYLFKQVFGNKEIPEWMMIESPEKQAELIKALYFGDGSYANAKYAHGTKEIFRINTTSKKLAKQLKEILLRLKIVSSLNVQKRKAPRKTMYVVSISGEYLQKFGEIVGVKVQSTMNNKKKATMFFVDDNYMYAPIKKIEKTFVNKMPVYNFGVRDDESYTANGIAVHNCTAPKYSTNSLHSAVVEVVAKENAHIRYTTIQNWAPNIYNLVTKRAFAYKNASVEWVDCNLGSLRTMKYPSVYLLGEGAKAEILSVALAGKTQHQDAGAKVMHFAGNTTSKITSKSISKDGGRTSYRGMVKVLKGCKNVKNTTKCDALLLDEFSRSDTYPTIEIDEPTTTIAHEATVGKVGDDQIFYLMSRGLSEEEALTLIVMGFIQPFTKELPMEYAVELNRLIQMEMEESVG